MIDCLAEYLCNANINACIADDCENPMFSGIDERAFIFNKSDIDELSSDPNNSNIINDIILKVGAHGYGIVNTRNNPFTGTNTAVEVGDYRNTFTRTVSLFVPMDGAEVIRNIIDPLANGRFVVVMRNQYVNEAGDNEYMIFGQDRGLKVSSLTQTKYENNDYWLVELQEVGVPTANKFFMYNGSTGSEAVDTIIYDGQSLAVSGISFEKSGDVYYMHYADPETPVSFVKAVVLSGLGTEYTLTAGNKTYNLTFASEPEWTGGATYTPSEVSEAIPTGSGAYLCSLCDC